MLGRRHFRVKVLQALYAYFQGGETRVEIAEKNLLQSIEKMEELFYLQISFLLDLLHFYEVRMEEAKHKFIPTEEELNPNIKLLNNRQFLQLKNNLQVTQAISRYKIFWNDEQEMLRKVNQKIKNSKELSEYLNSGTDSYEEDAAFLARLFRKYIARSGDLRSYCEERYLYWVDDFDMASIFILKMMKSMDEKFPPTSSPSDLFHRESSEEADDDRKFILELFRLTILHSEEYEKLIESRTRNWELERIALTDIILIKMALSELLHFSQIPVKVTLNEYIEISKQFSSQKSKSFINGILDKLVADLTAEKKIKKRGRGLMT
ncbi:MAG: transcription antitermination factor NusB [bacterium]